VRPPLALLAITLSAALARADDLHLPVAASDTEGMQAYESLPGKLTLDAALKIYRERGYDLLLADSAVLNAIGGLQSAAQFANPGVSFSYGRSFGPAAAPAPDSYSGDVNDNAAILDTLVVGKRRLRVEVAQAQLDSQKMSRVDAERNLISAFKQQWVACIAAKRQLEENGKILKSQQDTLDLIKTRYKAGAASEVDTSSQETATYEAAQQVAVAHQAYEQAKEGLAFLLGVRGKTPQFEVDPGLFGEALPSQTQDATVESFHDFAYGHRPDVIAQRLQVTEAQANIRLTRRQIVPDISLGVGYAQQVGPDPDEAITPPTVSVNVGFTLPLFYQMQGELTMAQSNLRTQQIMLAKLEAQVLSDVDSAWSAFRAARERRYRLEHGYLEQSKLAADLTKIQYEKGAASLVDYLVAERNYIATVQEYVQSMNDVWTAIFQLEQALGKELKS
jgi:cobalt-zinc-cadmium efflux system outer membrane protein